MNGWRSGVWHPFQEDLAAWAAMGWGNNPRSMGNTLAMLVRYSGVRATLLHRIAFWSHRRHIPLVPTLLAQANIALHAIDMPPSVDVGPGLYLPHTVGTVINAVSIGKRVTIQGGVTVGMKSSQEFPLIEDDVSLSAGCRVLGGIRVGRGAVIGANAVVLHDVPRGATMVGVPARPTRPERLTFDRGSKPQRAAAAPRKNDHEAGRGRARARVEPRQASRPATSR